MRKHESRRLEDGLSASGDLFGSAISFSAIDSTNHIVYADSNNFLHNLNGSSFQTPTYNSSYYIHGKCLRKEDWLKERENLLLEDHREQILSEL